MKVWKSRFTVMMVFVIGGSFFLSSSAQTQALAQKLTCYSPEQAAAEQAIKFHSELLVIGLNCRNVQLGGQLDSYAQYRRFTASHADLLAQYERRLLGFFKQQGHSDPDKALHTLRTDMANKLAEFVARVRPDVFCHKYAGRLDRANAMQSKDFKKWAATYFPSSPPSKEYCTEPSQ